MDEKENIKEQIESIKKQIENFEDEDRLKELKKKLKRERILRKIPIISYFKRLNDKFK